MASARYNRIIGNKIYYAVIDWEITNVHPKFLKNILTKIWTDNHPHNTSRNNYTKFIYSITLRIFVIYFLINLLYIYTFFLPFFKKKVLKIIVTLKKI